MTQIAQFRYYGNGHPNNYPPNMLQMQDGELACPTEDMLDKYDNITKVIISTLPGTILYLNGNSNNSYIIGTTGRLELDLSKNPIPLKGLTIDPKSISLLTETKEHSYFIITIVYNLTRQEAGNQNGE